MKTWRSFQVPLWHLLNKSDLQKVENFWGFLNTELSTLLRDKTFMSIAKANQNEYRGNFYKTTLNASGKSYLKWSINGEKAKYFRMLQYQIQQAFMSLNEREQVASICKKYNWDIDQIDAIRADCINESLYPTTSTLKNICRSGRIPNFPKKLSFKMDFSTGDKQIIIQDGLDYRLKINGEWFDLNVKKPSFIRPELDILKFSKPVIEKAKTGELVVRIGYQVECEEKSENNVAGVDLGRVKPFSMVVNYGDGSFSTELTESLELRNLSSKVDVLSREIDRIWNKRAKIESLLRERDDSYLVQHFEDLVAQSSVLSEKRSSLKEHASWVVARDVVNHSLESSVSEIRLENLAWLESRGGKWDYSSVQGKIVQVGELSGVKIVKVVASGTSQTDPYTDGPVVASGRDLKFGDGSVQDRDFTAAQEISRRKKRGGKTRVLRKGACRDKFAPTPKRPKAPSNKHKRLFFKKNSGLSVFVAASAVSQDFLKSTPGSQDQLSSKDFSCKLIPFE